MKQILAVVLIVCCLSMTTVYATVTQEDIDDAREQIDNLQQQVEDAENLLEEHNEKMDELEGDLQNLNTSLQILANNMNRLEEEILKKQNDVCVAEQELDMAKKQCGKQYEDMKTRIQYIYENGEVSVLELLLVSDSFSDYLNHKEYASQIHAYDREKMTEFEHLQKEVEERKVTLEQEEQKLLALNEALEKNQTKVNGMIASTEHYILETNEDIQEAEENIEDLEEQLKYWEEYEKKLEAEKLAQDLALWLEIQKAGQEDWSGVNYVQAEGDAYLLAAIIQCEADGEPYEGKLAVGSVVMNRVKSSRFPNTVTGVIYQNGQFSPVASGRLAYRLQAGVNETCRQAAAEVLNGRITNNCLFFRTVVPGIEGTIIGNHIFY